MVERFIAFSREDDGGAKAMDEGREMNKKMEFRLRDEDGR